MKKLKILLVVKDNRATHLLVNKIAQSLFIKIGPQENNVEYIDILEGGFIPKNVKFLLKEEKLHEFRHHEIINSDTLVCFICEKHGELKVFEKQFVYTEGEEVIINNMNYKKI